MIRIEIDDSTIERHGTLNDVVLLEGRCIGCGTCVNICPTKVIRVEDHDNVRTIAIRDDVIGRHPLERFEGCGALFAIPRFLDHIHDRIAPHPDVKVQHHYCPTCSKLFSDRVSAAGRRKYAVAPTLVTGPFLELSSYCHNLMGATVTTA